MTHDEHWFAHTFEVECCDEADDHGPDDDLPPLPDSPVGGPDEAVALLLRLVGAERDGPPALWFALLDGERRCLPLVLPVGGVPLRADRDVAGRVMCVLASVLDAEAPGGGVVVGLVRAAGGDLGAFEESWLPVLRDAADEQGVPVRAVAAIGSRRARALEW